jgi:hypothetical protein
MAMLHAYVKKVSNAGTRKTAVHVARTAFPQISSDVTRLQNPD